MKQMSSNTDPLVKKWIQYLKNNSLVDTNSSASGKLSYRKPIKADTVIHFLKFATDYDDEAIDGAIGIVGAKKLQASGNRRLQNDPSVPAPGSDISARTQQSPSSRPQQPRLAGPTGQQPSQPKKKKYNTDDATDIDWRDLNEDFQDDPGIEFDENDVEQIFNILSADSATPPAPDDAATAGDAQQSANNTDPEKKIAELKEVRRIVRDVMTPAQRKMLWGILQDQDAVNEAQMADSQIKSVLTNIAQSRNKKGIVNAFKKNVSFEALINEWRKQYKPDDSRDIKSILNRFGFSEKEISKAFATVSGDAASGEYPTATQTKAITQIADYIKKNDLVEDTIAFMKQEFASEINPGSAPAGIMSRMGKAAGKFVGDRLREEEVMELFDIVVKESIITRRQTELVHLGRTRK